MSHINRYKILAPNSKFYHGPFGRICGDLPAWSPPGFDPERDEPAIAAHFLDIAQTDMIEMPGRSPGTIARDRDLVNQLEAEFSASLPAGYTYFGQFVDHDITFDPASSLQRKNDPNGLLNHRTPRLDLDNIYGSGPANSPYLYDQKDEGKLLIGQAPDSNLKDLPRNNQGVALIGDKRNDENSIVSQLQLAFLMAHNTLVERARIKGHKSPFESARTTLRWLYQFIVWNDFVSRITNEDIRNSALKQESVFGGRQVWTMGLSDIYQWKEQPFMPVEFSIAAYRFGHSMVRNSYQTNNPHQGFENFIPIFDNSGADNPIDLRGFRPITKQKAIQWDWFLEMKTSSGPFPQNARKIDTKLANSLAALHEDPVAGSPLNILAFRNLMRAWQFGLPSGTDVANKFCAPLIDIEPDRDSLWFYILKEAEINENGNRLGAVGSLIVCATFAGLLKGDPLSWVNQHPCWTPDADPLLSDEDKVDSENWTLASIIRLSGLPVDTDDISNQS